MIMRDMLFVTWAVRPERVSKLIGERLQLDTKTDSTGREFAFVSAVCFSVAEVRSSVLPIGRVSFEQMNTRVYVKSGDVPAVCFLDVKVNSRMVTTLTSFLRVPVNYEEIAIKAAASDTGSVRYTIDSAGFRAEAITADGEDPASSLSLTSGFITDRLVGYVMVSDGMFEIEVEHPSLDSVSARIVRAEAPSLERLGILNPDESRRPHSALYVREASFGANTPTRES
jgi:uncharacterized protein YqjF (DUF2071 family)